MSVTKFNDEVYLSKKVNTGLEVFALLGYYAAFIYIWLGN